MSQLSKNLAASCPAQIATVLENDPAVRPRLDNPRDRAAAIHAIRFFAYGEQSPNPKWYKAETWRQIGEAFLRHSRFQNPIWYSIHNDDHSTLVTTPLRLAIGDLIEIEGDHRPFRFVTYVFDTQKNGHERVAFKGQNNLRSGDLRWRLLASISRQAEEISPKKSRTTPIGSGTHTITKKLEQLLTQIKHHPFFIIMAAITALVIAMANFTDSISRLFAFFRSMVAQ